MHSNRHGRVRMECGDGIPWSWRSYDDGGRVVFRLDQRDGSPVPVDGLDYAIGSLFGVHSAFATEYGYEPLAGDSSMSNDWAKVRMETRYVVAGGVASVVSRTWTRYEHGLTNVWPVVRTTRIRACSATAAIDDPGNETSVEERYDDRSGEVPYVLRGALVFSVGPDGMTTVCEHAVSNGVFVCTTRRYAAFPSAQLPVYETTETDVAYGNVLRRTTRLTDGGAIVSDECMTYDEKNRLRSTTYLDGTFETNAYSCCRLLWSKDRSGARRVRYAQTGTDHLYHAFVDESVRYLPKDDDFFYSPWSRVKFNTYAPVSEHHFDGLGRETNAVMRTGRIDDDILNPLKFDSDGLSSSSVTAYPQGVSDVSETVGFRGLFTRRTHLSSQHADTTVEEEYEPGESSPSAVATNVVVRGGGSIAWRGLPGKWTCEYRFSEYLADGCRVDYSVTESSDCGVVTNSVSTYDFLGRLASVATPLGVTACAYDGSSPRLISSTYAAGGVVRTSQYVYNSFGERVGETVNGVTSCADVTYETDASNIAWRVETRTVSSDGSTNSCAQTHTRMNGLSAAVRSEIVETRDGAEVSRTLVSYDAESETERETVSNAVGGVSWTVSKFGYPIESGSGLGTISNVYGPVGKVFIRRISSPGVGNRDLDVSLVDATGDELVRIDCDGTSLLAAPVSEFDYDCRGNRCEVVDVLGNSTMTLHDPLGNVVVEDGATYPARFDYDTQGRRMALCTTRDDENWDETAWGYDAATGLCTNKVYADGSNVAYTHTSDGLPLRTTYASGRWKENSYDARRNLSGVCHSDSSLDFSIARDVFGRVTNVTHAAGGEWWYEYGVGDTLLREIVVGRDVSIAPQTTKTLFRSFDAYARPTGLSLSFGGVAKGGVVCSYGDDGLLADMSVTNAAGRVFTVAYSNLSARCHGYVITTPGGAAIHRIAERNRYRRDILDGCSTTFNNSVVDSHAYTYDVLSRPTARTSSGISSSFAYNDRSEVVSAQIGTNIFAHVYDYIGNQTLFSANAATNAYTHNALNQIETVTIPQFSIVNSPFSISHDLDGNLTNDCIFAYSYDSENRLASVSSVSLTNGAVRVVNAYDYRNRRTAKTVQCYMDGDWQTSASVASQRSKVVSWLKDRLVWMDRSYGVLSHRDIGMPSEE